MYTHTRIYIYIHAYDDDDDDDDDHDDDGDDDDDDIVYNIHVWYGTITRKHPDSPTPLLYPTIGLTLHAIRKIMSHPR